MDDKENSGVGSEDSGDTTEHNGADSEDTVSEDFADTQGRKGVGDKDSASEYYIDTPSVYNDGSGNFADTSLDHNVVYSDDSADASLEHSSVRTEGYVDAPLEPKSVGRQDVVNAHPQLNGVGSEDSSDTSLGRASKKRTRGVTNMPEITCNSTEGQKRVIEYNEDGQPIGVNATKLKSFIGTSVRHHVPIIYGSWKKVPFEMKEKLYNLIKGGFVVDPRSKKNLLQNAGIAFRQFKHMLTTKHVMPFKDNLASLKNPPLVYSRIEQEHWDTFVHSRLSEEFERIRKRNQEMRGKNIYNHRLSRKGYANLAEELKKSSSYKGSLNERCVLWKSARMNKEGKIVDEQTQEVVNRMDKMLSMQAHTEVTSTTEDVLSLALGSTDHSGRVRGVGKFITPTHYFHKPKPSSRSKAGNVHQLEEDTDAASSTFEPEFLNACSALLGLEKGSVVSSKRPRVGRRAKKSRF